jgi:uncharacterized protein (DUF4213/DUF364 family)
MGVTSISAAYLRIGRQLAAALGHPGITGMHLPAPVEDETFRDEFGFVFLADGSVGPFYVSMDDILATLWQRHPDPARFRRDALPLLQGFDGSDPADRALALGTYNALSAALYRACGFAPPDRGAGSGLSGASPDELIGMIGYFRPLVDKLTAQGCSVLVLERSPQRVPETENVSVTTDPRALRACPQVLCSASVLINDSLEEILANLGEGARLELVGPSGSGVPDPLFARGVAAIGGISFPGRDPLTEHLARGGPWGTAGRKYQLDSSSYPGLPRLLERLSAKRADV